MSYADIPLGVECAWPAALAAPKPSVTRTARALPRIALALALLLGAWHLGQAAYIAAKAELAQVLMARAWQRTLAGERAVKPWPWADTWPVARLEVPGHDVELFVLAGADGRSIAFGPGHVLGTAQPGEAGNSVIGGHRDTHLRFLKEVRLGDRLVVQRPDGRRVAYRVSDSHIVDKSAVDVLAQDGPDRLTLVTCWPFDALRAGGPERYIVEAARTP
jgi:sortase A